MVTELEGRLKGMFTCGVTEACGFSWLSFRVLSVSYHHQEIDLAAKGLGASIRAIVQTPSIPLSKPHDIPYITPYITPLRSLDYSSYAEGCCSVQKKENQASHLGFRVQGCPPGSLKEVSLRLGLKL